MHIQTFHWLVGIGGSITSKKVDHFTAINPCLMSFQKFVNDYMAFWIIFKTKLLLGLSLSFVKKTCSTSFRYMKG
jgi:hypothetical protein